MKILVPLLALAALNTHLAACGEADTTPVNPAAVPTATHDRQSAAREDFRGYILRDGAGVEVFFK